MIHDDKCERSGKWYKRRECREFSTDGTAMGATIAHTFSTTDENEIARLGEEHDKAESMGLLTGMDEEQADWEEDDDDPEEQQHQWDAYGVSVYEL